MSMKIKFAALLVTACFAFAFAGRSQELKIVPDPDAIGVRNGGDTVRVEWIQLTRPGAQSVVPEPAAAKVYFARSPFGADLAKYDTLGSVLSSGSESFGSEAMKRFVEFVPNNQGGRMGAGAYYGIVAAVVPREGGADTLFSDYFTLMVESVRPPMIVSPKANLMAGQTVASISDMTPTFRWNAVSGVPYYHVLLTDAPLFDLEGTEVNIAEDFNIIWQAITPNTQISYGSPDPSGTITANPPPLAPGRVYSWIVLNNYGNHMAYSSGVIDTMGLITARFRINRTPELSAPTVVKPKGATFNVDDPVVLEWTGIDPNANAFLVNVFAKTDAEDVGMADIIGEELDLRPGVLIWETTVSRGSRDTLRVTFDAKSTLSDGDFDWHVYALDSRGAGMMDPVSSVGSFKYKRAMGTIEIQTEEYMGGDRLAVGFVELRTERLDGPAQAPLAFYTANNGLLSRDFPEGTYRITAVKEGYEQQALTVTVPSSTGLTRILMTRPQAILYGRVGELAGADTVAVNLAKVTAVSEWGDTVTAFTDGSGVFMLSCIAADWTVQVEKAGYEYVTPLRVSLRPGDNRNITADGRQVIIKRSPYVLAGIVMNANGQPISRARVSVFSEEGVLVSELASTPQNGVYEFFLSPGSYILTAEKPGLITFSGNISLSRSQPEVHIVMEEGAALVNGVVIGKGWVPDATTYNSVSAPIPSARISFVDKDGGETFVVSSDAVFGRFTAGLRVNRTYKVSVEASGYNGIGIDDGREFFTGTIGGVTLEFGSQFTDTLAALGMIKGNVSAQGGAPLGGADVFVYDAAGDVVVSGRTSGDGSYEVRGIPDGEYTVGAGLRGFYATSPVSGYTISFYGGRPFAASASHNFTMGEGTKVIRWDVVNDNVNNAVIKIVSPFRASVDYSRSAEGGVTLESVGPGVYVVEAEAVGHPSVLHLSRHKFTVGEDDDEYAANLSFLVQHTAVDEIDKGANGYTLSFTPNAMPGVAITKVELFYRSEGSVQYQSIDRVNFPTGWDYTMNIPSNTVRNGANLYYYFRVSLSNGDVYGSEKQIFRTYVKPDPNTITSISVNPSTAGGATLFLPSNYDAQFTFEAAYSSVNTIIAESVGSVKWTILSEGGDVIKTEDLLSDRPFTFPKQSDSAGFTLRAVLTPSAPYSIAQGVSPTVTFPVRVTGLALDSVAISRGVSGPINNRAEASFKFEAFDVNRRRIAITPRWSVRPSGAGVIGEAGLFRPDSGFIGVAMIVAEAGGMTAEYEQQVDFVLRNSAAKVATLSGLALEFGNNSVSVVDGVRFGAAVPNLDNHVYKGSDGWMSIDGAFTVTCSDPEAVRDSISVILDIPAHLRGAAQKGEQAFMVGKWSFEELKWVEIANSRVINDGAAVLAKVAYNGGSAGGLQRRRRLSKGMSASSVSASAALDRSAMYALITKTGKLSLNVTVSPHPFSPNIRPVIEYGSEAREGTCIRVKVEAPETFVRSIKVHIYNATGKMVWAVEKKNAEVGENKIWWNGRTSVSGGSRSKITEEMWTENFPEMTRNRPMARNGRYFVTVIVTDINGNQRREMKPVVLMK